MGILLDLDLVGLKDTNMKDTYKASMHVLILVTERQKDREINQRSTQILKQKCTKMKKQ